MLVAFLHCYCLGIFMVNVKRTVTEIFLPGAMIPLSLIIVGALFLLILDLLIWRAPMAEIMIIVVALEIIYRFALKEEFFLNIRIVKVTDHYESYIKSL